MWGAEPALRWKARGIWHSATWAEYLSAARALGLALADLGVARGEVVTLLAENRPEWLYADMGAQVRRLQAYSQSRSGNGKPARSTAVRGLSGWMPNLSSTAANWRVCCAECQVERS